MSDWDSITQRYGVNEINTTPEPKVENITDGSWPPKIGALYNGKGPIKQIKGEYGYDYEDREELYGGNKVITTRFIVIPKPLTKEEAEQAQLSLNANKEAKSIYESNGPIGAPKVLAIVHIAHPRLHTKNSPQVPVGSFVLAFYKLHLRTIKEDGNEVKKWYYTKLFEPVSLGNDANVTIKNRFEKPYVNEDTEFEASYDTKSNFEPSYFITNVNSKSEVVIYKRNDNLFIGRAFALIGFDCENFDIDDAELKKTYSSTNQKYGRWVIPVKLTNQRIIYYEETVLTYILELINESRNGITAASLFAGFKSADESKIILGKQKRLDEIKQQAFEILTQTNVKSNKIKKTINENDAKIKEFKASQPKIEERERIKQKGIDKTTFRQSTKDTQAEEYMPLKEYEQAKANIQQIPILEAENKELSDELARINKEFNENEIINEYRQLFGDIQKGKGKEPVIFYDYTYLSETPPPIFFIDPDFTPGNLIRLVGENSGILQASRGGKRKSKKSIKSKKSMKVKRTMKQYRKHTKKYRRRSYRK
jgi:hypothetical protein